MERYLPEKGIRVGEVEGRHNDYEGKGAAHLQQSDYCVQLTCNKDVSNK
jgi:hypothetical protein